jgi:hypothetical protein
MRKLVVAFAFLLAACGQSAEVAAPAPEAAPAAVENLCDARASGTWRDTFAVEASTAGSSCKDAEATLTVKNEAGVELLRFTAPIAQVMVLASAADVPAMRTALADWIKGEQMPTSAALPAWAAGANNPGGEFPFYPEDGVTRERYDQVRAANLPMFCFVQGMESMACHVLENDAFVKLGVQTFPG